LEPDEVMTYHLARRAGREPVPRLRWQSSEPGVQELLVRGAPCLKLQSGENPASRGLRAIHGPGKDGPWLAINEIRITAPVRGRQHARSEARETEPQGGLVRAGCGLGGVWKDECDRDILTDISGIWCHATPEDLLLIDLHITLQASVGPVTLEPECDTGLVTLHLAESLQAATWTGGSGAVGDDDIHRVSGPWVHGLGRLGGLAIFDSPENPAGPATFRLHPDGRLVIDPWAAWSRWETLAPMPRLSTALALSTGDSLRFSYRLYLHHPDRPTSLVRRHYCDFAFPPRVEVEEYDWQTIRNHPADGNTEGRRRGRRSGRGA
jgi:hypothetical protein